MLPQPDRLWKQVIEAYDSGTCPGDPFLKRVYSVMVGETEDETVQYALEKIAEPKDRDAIVAYILSGATNEMIANSLWIRSTEVVDVFSKLYMDITVFRDKLEHLRYCEYYLEDRCEDDERNQALIQQGISHGPKALELWWKRAKDEVNIDRDDIADAVLRMAFTNAMAAKDVSVTHPIAKEAHRWVKTALDAIQVRDADRDDLGEDLDAMLAIEKHLSTKTPEEANVPLDQIMH